MKILFKQEIRNNGIIVLEKEEHIRTLCFSGNKKFNRIFFPNIQFYIRYRIENRSYVYLGIEYSSLRVSFSKKPISDVNDLVFIPPQDSINSGFVCTSHDLDYIYDGMSFKTLEELYQAVVLNYFSLDHAGLLKRTKKEDWETFFCPERWTDTPKFKDYLNIKDKRQEYYSEVETRFDVNEILS